MGHADPRHDVQSSGHRRNIFVTTLGHRFT